MPCAPVHLPKESNQSRGAYGPLLRAPCLPWIYIPATISKTAPSATPSATHHTTNSNTSAHNDTFLLSSGAYAVFTSLVSSSFFASSYFFGTRLPSLSRGRRSQPVLKRFLLASKRGKGCASVFKTIWSRGRTSLGEKRRYMYFRVSACCYVSKCSALHNKS
jgi:hypothetical protein